MLCSALRPQKTFLKQPGLGAALLGCRGRQDQALTVKAGRHLQIENRELLTGDCLLLVAFCLYKQAMLSS